MVLLSCLRFVRKTNVFYPHPLSKFRPYGEGPLVPASEIKLADYPNRSGHILALRTDRPCSVLFDLTLSRFIGLATRKGQRTMMRELMRETFCLIKQIQLAKFNECSDEEERSKICCDPLEIFHEALENCKPILVTKPVKRGGATYQVPFPISEKQSEDLAIRWLLETVREQPKPRKKNFPEMMAKELIDSYYQQGKVIKRKQDMHRQCENNKAYAHYRWG